MKRPIPVWTIGCMLDLFTWYQIYPEDPTLAQKIDEIHELAKRDFGAYNDWFYRFHDLPADALKTIDIL